MSLKDLTIDKHYDSKRGYLECAYQRFINNELSRLDDDKKIERWEIYNMISNELVSYGYLTELAEFKYRITDKENPNDVILDILDGIECTSLLHTLYGMIEIFREEDFYVGWNN